MGERIAKILAKMTEKQRAQILSLIASIVAGRLDGLDVKKLKTVENAYRVRKGDFRIVFVRAAGEEPRIIAVERRSDTTYNEF